MYTSGKEQLMGSRNFIRMLYTKENIKVYGSDGNIIQFSVFMVHFGNFFLIPQRSFCRLQTLTEALKRIQFMLGGMMIE